MIHDKPFPVPSGRCQIHNGLVPMFFAAHDHEARTLIQGERTIDDALAECLSSMGKDERDLVVAKLRSFGVNVERLDIEHIVFST